MDFHKNINSLLENVENNISSSCLEYCLFFECDYISSFVDKMQASQGDKANDDLTFNLTVSILFIYYFDQQ